MPTPGPAVTQKLMGVDVNVVDTVRKHELGLTLDFADGTRRRYVKASGAIALNDALVMDTAVLTAAVPYVVKTSSAALQPIAGVCMVSGVADTNFFWAVVGGKANVKVAAAVAAGAHLATTATAGTLDDVAAAAADAQAAAAGIGTTVLIDDSPSAGIALVLLS